MMEWLVSMWTVILVLNAVVMTVNVILFFGTKRKIKELRAITAQLRFQTVELTAASREFNASYYRLRGELADTIPGEVKH